MSLKNYINVKDLEGKTLEEMMKMVREAKERKKADIDAGLGITRVVSSTSRDTTINATSHTFTSHTTTSYMTEDEIVNSFFGGSERPERVEASPPLEGEKVYLNPIEAITSFLAVYGLW